MIVAKTVKGKGAEAVENKDGAHGKALDDPEAAIAELGGERADLRIEVAQARGRRRAARVRRRARSSFRRYELGGRRSRRARPTATRSRRSASRDGKVVALDGEVSNSTFSEIFREAHPERYFEMYIAEQQMVAAAVGLQVRGWRPFASTFAAFHARAYDFVRMAAISRATMALCGSHAGVSIGEDGPSQMALEDLAEFRAVWRLDRALPLRREPDGEARRDDGRARRDLVPADDARGDADHLRARRGVPGRRQRRSCAPPTRTTVTIVGAGITLHEALKAADALGGGRHRARASIDRYSVKPIDAATLRAAAEATDGRIVTVEDHWPEGGLGEAVLAAFADAERAAAGDDARAARDAGLGHAGRAPRAGGHRRGRRSPAAVRALVGGARTRLETRNTVSRSLERRPLPGAPGVQTQVSRQRLDRPARATMSACRWSRPRTCGRTSARPSSSTASRSRSSAAATASRSPGRTARGRRRSCG